MGKKRPRTIGTMVSVPRALKDRIGKVKEDVNWSALACRAFENKLAEITTKKRRKLMATGMSQKERREVADRLGKTRGVQNTAHYKYGWSSGLKWAQTKAEAYQLQRLSERAWNWLSPRNSVDDNPALNVAVTIEPAGVFVKDCDPDDSCDFNDAGLCQFWNRITGRGSELRLEGYVDEEEWRDPKFQQGFVEAASSVWLEVKEQF